jgi:endonuclease YncB( thermonuclease family)
MPCFGQERLDMKFAMNRIGTVFFCAVLLCASRPARAADSASSQEQEFTARIIAVLDGDTVLVRRHGRLMKIRLAEIDAPEKAQPYGETSRLSLSGMVMGKPVKIAGQTMDQYGRLLAHLSVTAPRPAEGRASDETTDMTTSHLTNPAKNAGQVIGYSQSASLAINANRVAGYGGTPLAGDCLDVNAEQIRRGMAWEYSNFHSNKALVMLQNQAKRTLRGLWKQGHPIPPWKWRKSHPYVLHDKRAIPG